MVAPRDLAALGAADFQAAIGTGFQVSLGRSAQLLLRLVEVVELDGQPSIYEAIFG